jgi:hypothetical protein
MTNVIENENGELEDDFEYEDEPQFDDPDDDFPFFDLE